ncbi:hypothetical protein GGR56DRAFT_671342 [Xylariaceae sp. FL0804]|nr:hypothetical protein GGR56DRAFT_671342 [Xylariaceae sp. FL0804]
MADEASAAVSTSTVNATGRAPSATSHAPPGYGLRRAATVAQPGQLHRRPTMSNSSPSGDGPHAGLRRRSSAISDYSLSDARKDLEFSAEDLFNPGRRDSTEMKKTRFVYVPLTLALLPAVAGVFFENGSAFFTDIILLSLAAVFMHWSVTQPWEWYQSAQQVRIVKDEIMTETVFETDSEGELSPALSAKTALENVPEESSEEQRDESESVEAPIPRPNEAWEAQQAAGLEELYYHEMLALAWCFAFPMLGAYLLHTIRSQLSRPSGGLVSDYNLTIFLCAAEIRPVSHLIRLIQDRTIQVQQIVAENPFAKPTVAPEELQTLRDRLDELEARPPPPPPGATAASAANGNGSLTMKPEVSQKAIETAVGREVRSAIQPELDALNRAMRRYEKKLTLLACQMDNRIEYVDYRLNDAIALAAVAAKNSNARGGGLGLVGGGLGFGLGGLAGWLLQKTGSMLMAPVQAAVAVFQAAASVCTFPVRTTATLFRRKKGGGGSSSSRSASAPADKTQRAARNGKMPLGRVSSGDRVPTRVSSRR